MTRFSTLRALPALRTALLLGLSAVMWPAAAQGPFTGKPRYQVRVQQAGGTVSGLIELELFPLIAPGHVRNWDSLVTYHFFDTTAFHRVVPGFVIQGGDPNSRHGPRSTWGYGQPNQPTVNAEFSAVSHERGIVSAARDANINSASSQFFICVAPARSLNGQYSAYGRVTSGLSVVDQIVNAPRDASDNPVRKIEMFVTRIGSNDSVPAVPTPRPVALGTTGAATLRWSRVPDAMLYHVQFATAPDSLFAGPLVLDEQLSQRDTTRALSALLAGTTYYWRVQANNGGHLSGFTAPQRFRTGVAAPTLLAPANNATLPTLAPQLVWAPAAGATTYRVQVATSRLFLPAQLVLEQDAGAGPTFQLPAPLPNGVRHYWRVQPMSGTVPGFFSNPWSFIPTTPLAAAELLQEKLLLAAPVPNPATASTTLAYYLPVAGAARLVLSDALGREKGRWLEQAQCPAGAGTVTVRTTTLAPGLYVCRLEVNGQTCTQRLVIQ